MGNKKLGVGMQKQIAEGVVALNYYCVNCKDMRTFCSSDKMYCISVNEHIISVDVVLKCSGCSSTVQVWYLVESQETLYSPAPEIRILKKSEKLPKNVQHAEDEINEYTELLDKAERAYRDSLGAGAVVYLRKVYELITARSAAAAHISTRTEKNRKKAFKDLLKEVDEKLGIIPKEYSDNGYRLFGELSDIIHGDYDEELGLQKYSALRCLVVGILKNVKSNNELLDAIGAMGWNRE
ncbi:MAG: hypothetical protein PHP02_03620 [Eubacteriales bacterium]|nr:hypothetical protein [Eubacteriales bacterium]